MASLTLVHPHTLPETQGQMGSNKDTMYIPEKEAKTKQEEQKGKPNPARGPLLPGPDELILHRYRCTGEWGAEDVLTP